MKKYKALKNFKCNGVKKEKGQFLTDAEKDQIGPKFGKQLLHDDILQVESSNEDHDEPFNNEPNGEDESEDQAPDEENEEQGEDEVEEESSEDEESEAEINLEEMNKEALLAYAKELGLDIHGRTGEEKIREAIQAHLAG